MSEAERALALRHYGQALAEFGRVRRSHPGLDRDDLRQACLLALCLAVQSWRPYEGPGEPFAHWLRWQIRAQAKALRSQSRPGGYKNAGRDGVPPSTVAASLEALARSIDGRFSYS